MVATDLLLLLLQTAPSSRQFVLTRRQLSLGRVDTPLDCVDFLLVGVQLRLVSLQFALHDGEAFAPLSQRRLRGDGGFKRRCAFRFQRGAF
ncbi:MAG TPA: hypothetical protein PLV92_26810, partial [Pirellulaceae bacterium]|nr:hypothetical protein [Pirellulaceae bacterium]